MATRTTREGTTRGGMSTREGHDHPDRGEFAAGGEESREGLDPSSRDASPVQDERGERRERRGLGRDRVLAEQADERLRRMVSIQPARSGEAAGTAAGLPGRGVGHAATRLAPTCRWGLAGDQASPRRAGRIPSTTVGFIFRQHVANLTMCTEPGSRCCCRDCTGTR